MAESQFGFLVGVATVLLADYLIYDRIPAPLDSYLNKRKE